nr:hypothetical protein [Sporolactobacillus mangiferae]
MKNKHKNDYSRLKRKVFFQMLLITAATVLTVFLLRHILQGQIGNRIVRFLIGAFHFEDSEALTIYQLVIRNNMDMILFAACLIFLAVLFRFSVSWFTRYFDEVSAGIDKLAEESDDDITLSPELDFMEKS